MFRGLVLELPLAAMVGLALFFGRRTRFERGGMAVFAASEATGLDGVPCEDCGGGERMGGRCRRGLECGVGDVGCDHGTWMETGSRGHRRKR